MHQAKPSTPNQKTPKVSETKFTNPFRDKAQPPKILTKVTILVPPQGRCIQINRVRTDSPKRTKNHCMIESIKTRKDKSQVFVLKT